MNEFQEKLLNEFEKKLIEFAHINLEEFLESTRMNKEELNKVIDNLIEEEGVFAARRELFWKVNILSVIYKERHTGTQMTNEEVVKHAAENGLLLE